MTDRLRIRLDEEIGAALAHAERMLGGAEEAARGVMARAINRALSSTATAGTRAVTAAYTVKAGRVREEVRVHPTTAADLVGEIVVRGRPLSASSFKFSPKSYNRWTRPVRLEVRRGSPREIEGAFVAAPFGRAVLFKRGGTGRAGIEGIARVSVPQMMENSEAVEAMTARASEVLSKRVEHELQRALDRGAK